jgi:hypothetical protein
MLKALLAPHAPLSIEARYFYYGLPSQPHLAACSSTYMWLKPEPESYPHSKNLGPLGFAHLLQEVWDVTVGPAIVAYLDGWVVEWTSLDPVHIGYADEPSHPAIIWIGVHPSSLLAKTSIEIAVHCKHLLSAHRVNNVHVKICESEVFHTASDSPKLYKPLPTSKPNAYV